MSKAELLQVFNALKKVIEKVHRISPQTKILLSYITTPTAIYGPDYEHCLKNTSELFPNSHSYAEACHDAIERQSRLSGILSNWSRQLNIDYIDPTPELRQAGQREHLHFLNNPHLNKEGGRIYAEVLTKKINEMLNKH